MKIDPIQDLQIIKNRRDGVLHSIVDAIPFARFLGLKFQRLGNELTAIMPFDPKLIGNPLIPALHGGGTAGFLETTAIIGLTWHTIWDDMESGKLKLDEIENQLPNLPKTIDISMDYLRAGRPRDSYARATINRSGRRYASVHVETWQDRRELPFASAVVHVLMPDRIFGTDDE